MIGVLSKERSLNLKNLLLAWSFEKAPIPLSTSQLRAGS